MDFIDFEASEETTSNEPLAFTDEEDEGGSFYRRLKPEKFQNQTRNTNPKHAVYENDKPFSIVEET